MLITAVRKTSTSEIVNDVAAHVGLTAEAPAFIASLLHRAIRDTACSRRFRRTIAVEFDDSRGNYIFSDSVSAELQHH